MRVRLPHCAAIAIYVCAFPLAAQEYTPVESVEIPEELALDTNALAVLPIEILTTDPRAPILASEAYEAILNQLAAIEGLSVMGRESVLPYADSVLPAVEIARRLGVGSILESNIRVVESDIRAESIGIFFGVDLIDARTGESVGSDYLLELNPELRIVDRPFNLATLMSDMASGIAEQVETFLAAPWRSQTDPQQVIAEAQERAEPTTTGFELPVPTRSAEEISLQTAFTFVRIEYSAHPDRARGGWTTDYPDADRNFSRQFESLTGLATNLYGLTLRLTDPALQQYPFIYIVEGGQMSLSNEEGLALRNYLLGGGFLMVDDFHGEQEWASFVTELRRAFPDREPVELPLDHEIFQSYYELSELPQVPGRGGSRSGTEAHYLGLIDDDGRLMAIFCHNSDFGDAWEHVDDPWYPRELSLGVAIPLGINIVVYALLH